MKDSRGVTLEEGQSVLFSKNTGDFGAHQIVEGKVAKITAKMVCVGYDWDTGYRKVEIEYTEGHYYPHAVTVVILPPVSD